MPTFSKKQKEYILKANRRYNFKIGAVRSGKSYVDIADTILRRLLTVKDKEGLNVIIGVAKETIERNVLHPMREIYGGTYISQINSRNLAYLFGMPVYCLGAEKANAINVIQGMSVKYCYGDEIAKWNEGVFTMLQSRLDKEYSKFDGACNPEFPGHWLKAFLDRDDIDKYVQKYTIFDNPFIPKAFVDNLCQEYKGTVYYKRYILGEWALAEGLIYPMWESAIGQPPQNSQASEYSVSIDYGTLNAFAALQWEKHENIWYATNEFYYSGRSLEGTKTDADYVKYMIDFVSPFIDKIPVEGSIFAGGTSQAVETIIDPSAASFIAALREYPQFRVRNAKNDVDNGIRNTARAMQAGKIKFAPWLKNWKAEVQGYVWDDRDDIDAPIKMNDHLMDSMRYEVQTKRIAATEDNYKSAFA